MYYQLVTTSPPGHDKYSVRMSDIRINMLMDAGKAASSRQREITLKLLDKRKESPNGGFGVAKLVSEVCIY